VRVLAHRGRKSKGDGGESGGEEGETIMREDWARRQFKRRDFLTMGATVAAGVALGACNGGPENNPAVRGQTGGEFGAGDTYTGPDLELEFWNGFTGGDGPYMQELVQRFDAEHDNISVAQNTVEWDVYYQKVPASVPQGRGPDVGVMHVDTLATNAARQVIIPLDDLADALKLQESDFHPTVWAAGVYNGARYGIPLDIHPLGCYFNKRMFEQANVDPDRPPQSHDEYMGALEEMKSKGIQGHWVSPFTTWMFQSLLWQFGGDLYNSEVSEAAYNTEAGVAALSWMVDLVKNGYSPENVGEGSEALAFTDDRNAFYWDGPWQINEYKTTKDFEWGIMPLPRIGTEPAAWASSHNFVITNKPDQDPNKFKAAKVFINWISDHSLEWAGAGQVPARASVRETTEFEEHDELSIFSRQLDYVHFLPPEPGIADATLPLTETALPEAILLKAEPQDALDQAAQQTNQILEENAEKYGT
jgi:multiple sugar transport system substrate-binding protein